MNLEELIKKGELIFLSHFGLITQPLIAAMIDALEQVDEEDESFHFPQKLYVIFIEVTQNIMHYSLKDDYKAFVSIGSTDEYYYLLSQNLVTKKDKDKIEKLLNEISNLNKKEIKELYRERRKSGEKSHSTGGGIGFLEIAKVADKIEFKFEKVEEHYVFTLKVYVKKVPQKKTL